MTFPLSSAAQSELLDIARKCLEERLKTGQVTYDPPECAELQQPSGVFVTLYCEGHLRGCIGVPQALAPLHESVRKSVVSAATADSRFDPLTLEELKNIELEVSILSNLETIVSPDEIKIGTHGLMLTRGVNRGLLLPQVAVEHGWDSVTFIRQVCRKAGLPEDAWQQKEARIERFCAQVVRERKKSA